MRRKRAPEKRATEYGVTETPEGKVQVTFYDEGKTVQEFLLSRGEADQFLEGMRYQLVLMQKVE